MRLLLTRFRQLLNKSVTERETSYIRVFADKRRVFTVSFPAVIWDVMQRFGEALGDSCVEGALRDIPKTAAKEATASPERAVRFASFEDEILHGCRGNYLL